MKRFAAIFLSLLIACASFAQVGSIAASTNNVNVYPATLPDDLKALFSVLAYNVSGNEMPGVIGGHNITITNKDFSSNFIPSTSTCTLSLPDLAALKNDDAFDGAFYTDAGAIRQVTVSSLLNNDFSRVLVRYSNTSPYFIEWIGLLDDAATPTQSQWNRLHTYFKLHTFWSGVANDYGFEKENISLEGRTYKGWASMVSYLSLTLPSESVKSSINKFCIDLTNYGLFSGFDRLWLWMLNDAALVPGAGTVSLKTPEATRLSFPVAPTYSTSGIKGNGTTQYALSNFNPSTQGINYTLNSATVGTYVYDAGNNGHFIGGSSFTVWITGANCRVNSAGFPSVNLNGTGYTAASRNAASGAGCLLAYKETTQTSLSEASTSVSTSITFLQSSGSFSTSGLSVGFAARNFTQTENGNFRTAFLAHKTRLGL